MLMQSDGNLVTYDLTQGTPVWASGTGGNPGAYLTLSYAFTPGGYGTTFAMRVVAANGGQLWGTEGSTAGYIAGGIEQLVLQSDSNLQFSGFGNLFWQSGTAGTAYSVLLEPGQSITSANGHFQLIMQTDGNLVEYLVAQGDPLWSTGTQGNPGSFAAMQTDGNLVVYSADGVALWASGTAAPNATLTLQDDGNLVIYGTNSAGQYPVWSSHTNNVRGYKLTSGQLLQAGQYLVSQNHQYVLNMSSGGNLTISSIGQYLCPMWSVPAIKTANSQVFPPQSGAYLQLTSSGDLALWHPGQSSGSPMWDAGTSGGETAVLQDDGDLIVYSATGTALWSSGTSSDRGSYLCAGSTLSPGQRIYAWQTANPGEPYVQGPGVNAIAYFAMQSDCNLVFYLNDGEAAAWASNTDESQADPQGYAAGLYNGCYAVLQSQGNLVVYAPNDGNKVLWSSGPGQASAPKDVPPVVGPVFLLPILGGLTNTPNIYSSAGPLLGTPLPVTSGGAAQWVVSAFNTLVFFFGVDGGSVGAIATVLGGASTAISDLPTGAPSSGGSTGQTSLGPGTSTGQASAVPGSGSGPATSSNPTSVTTCTAGSPDQLVGGGQLAPGGCLHSPNGEYALVMQANDGNLVLYKQSQGLALWATGTVGNPGAYLRLQANDGNLVESNQAGTAALWSTGTTGTSNPAFILQNDGNLVLYANGAGGGIPSAVWSSGTASKPPITTCAAGSSPSVLQGNQVLASGGCLRSANGRYALVMQADDGNLVLSDQTNNEALWSTATEGNPGAYLRLQSIDGNLVLSNRAGTAALWSTGIIAPKANLVLQNDGNLVLYANNDQNGIGAVPYAAWATGTQSFRGSTLPAGQVLQPGQYLQNGQFRLTMGTTGLLVLTQTTASSTVCPMWTVPTADASLPDTSYSYSGSFPSGFVSTAPTPGAYLTMQTQGNLVLYPPQGGASASWATPTGNNPGATLSLSGSGIVAVEATNGTVLWQALPTNDEGLMLCAGGSLGGGEYITGDQPGNGGSELVMQSDCNLVLYTSGTATWSSNTAVSQAGQGKNPLSKSAAAAGDYNGCHVQMQTDGNLVMYAPNAPNGAAMWASNSEQSSAFSLGQNIGPYYVTTGSDGYARIYNLLGTQLWDAGAGTTSSGDNGANGQSTAQTIFEIIQLVAAFA